MNSHSTEDLVRRFYEGWNNGSIDFADLVAEDIVNHQPEAEPEHGRQRFEEAVKGVMRAVPDSQWTVSDLLADGDRRARTRPVSNLLLMFEIPPDTRPRT